MNTAASWHVGRPAGRCAACNTDLPPATPCWAALCESSQPAPGSQDHPRKTDNGAAPETPSIPFVRVDLCEKCWAEGKRPADVSAAAGEMFSFWKTIVPAAQQKKKLLVDDSVLMDVFARMEGKREPQEVRFRFVLALILMRKRLLRYEGVEEQVAGEGEVWRMVVRGSGAGGGSGGGGTGGETPGVVHVVNPHLTEEQIAEVSQQLSAILAEEL